MKFNNSDNKIILHLMVSLTLHVCTASRCASLLRVKTEDGRAQQKGNLRHSCVAVDVDDYHFCVRVSVYFAVTF